MLFLLPHGSELRGFVSTEELDNLRRVKGQASCCLKRRLSHLGQSGTQWDSASWLKVAWGWEGKDGHRWRSRESGGEDGDCHLLLKSPHLPLVPTASTSGTDIVTFFLPACREEDGVC